MPHSLTHRIFSLSPCPRPLFAAGQLQICNPRYRSRNGERAREGIALCVLQQLERSPYPANQIKASNRHRPIIPLIHLRWRGSYDVKLEQDCMQFHLGGISISCIVRVGRFSIPFRLKPFFQANLTITIEIQGSPDPPVWQRTPYYVLSRF